MLVVVSVLVFDSLRFAYVGGGARDGIRQPVRVLVGVGNSAGVLLFREPVEVLFFISNL